MIAAFLGEGSTDRALLPAVSWVIRTSTLVASEVRWVEAWRIPATRTLADRVVAVQKLQPFDLLFVHRDADNQPPSWRRSEIAKAAGDVLHVAVVPVRMTESWLLPHEAALREACGRPSGTEPLGIPALSRIEKLADPKQVLHDALIVAAGPRVTRRRTWNAMAAFHQIAERVEDWAPLRQLTAFRELEHDTRAALRTLGLPLLDVT